MVMQLKINQFLKMMMICLLLKPHRCQVILKDWSVPLSAPMFLLVRSWIFFTYFSFCSIILVGLLIFYFIFSPERRYVIITSHVNLG